MHPTGAHSDEQGLRLDVTQAISHRRQTNLA
jgi:hypothetical protein